MSEPALEKCVHSPVAPEAERFTRITFHCERQDGTVTIHEAECGVDISILGLKKDLQNVFNLLPEKQQWDLRSRVLEDNYTLASYGLTGTEPTSRTTVKIYVKLR